ncbi:MAG: ribonuclease III [Christensenellales bacterium]
MQNNFYAEAEQKIGYSFKNKELLLRAFTHSSYTNEHKNVLNYERLEFLGDAVLGYVVGLYLYETFPDFSEGKLSKMRASVVDRTTIASVVTEMDIMKYVRVGAGSAQGDIKNSKKANCDIFEAIIGAIVIDNNDDLTEAKNFILRNLENKITPDNDDDYKTMVWELCAKRGDNAQIVTLKEGLDGLQKTFSVGLSINGRIVSEGEGHNKALAAKDACKKFLHK